MLLLLIFKKTKIIQLAFIFCEVSWSLFSLLTVEIGC